MMSKREMKKIYSKAWRYAPAVREMHYRRHRRYQRQIRYWQRVQERNERSMT